LILVKELIITARLLSLMRPILGFRRIYLPQVIVYFAYGALDDVLRGVAGVSIRSPGESS
jgi:hypothetical protein